MKKILITVTVILGITSISHALALPQPTRCLLIDFYDFDKEGEIYFRKDVSESSRGELKAIIKNAENRVARFWGEKTTNPKFIYCDTDDDFTAFGSPFSTPAATIMHIQSYIVISKDGADLDIISHELSHAELFARIGVINRNMKIPVWFDEGLAMQVDHRSYYSIDTLKSISNNFQSLPNVKNMEDYSTFGAGSREEIMMNYRTAKYEVANWYTPSKLDKFVQDLNNGKSFEEAYK